MKALNIAIVGATGAVGQEILNVMEERKVPFKSLKMLASTRSAGSIIEYQGKSYIVEETTEKSFDGIDMALFAGGPASRAYGRIAQSKGVIVIDNSSTFRLEEDVPLIVPEVNGEAAKNHRGLIASPNCSTTLLVGAVYPIYKEVGIKRLLISTYQAVSGAGKEGIDELVEQSRLVLDGEEETTPSVFQHQIAFNLIPHIDVWMEEDYSKEELKLVHETRKILNDPNIGISSTAVRVPVFRSHAESIYLEANKEIDADKARELLKEGEGIVLQDDPQNNIYPMPIETSHKDEIFVGRVRNDLSQANAINLWACFDQIRKGAATNTVQIMELLLKNDWV